MDKTSTKLSDIMVKVHFGDGFQEEILKTIQFENLPIALHTIQAKTRFLEDLCPGIQKKDLQAAPPISNKYLRKKNKRAKYLRNLKEYHQCFAFENENKGCFEIIRDKNDTVGDIRRLLTSSFPQLNLVNSWKLVLRCGSMSISRSSTLSDLIDDDFEEMSVEKDKNGKEYHCLSFDVILEQTGG